MFRTTERCNVPFGSLASRSGNFLGKRLHFLLFCVSFFEEVFERIPKTPKVCFLEDSKMFFVLLEHFFGFLIAILSRKMSSWSFTNHLGAMPLECSRTWLFTCFVKKKIKCSRTCSVSESPNVVVFGLRHPSFIPESFRGGRSSCWFFRLLKSANWFFRSQATNGWIHKNLNCFAFFSWNNFFPLIDSFPLKWFLTKYSRCRGESTWDEEEAFEKIFYVLWRSKVARCSRFAASFFYKKFCKMLGSFLKVHRYALSILETAWKFYKIFPCRVREFSMFYKKLACMHECSMENLPADSTRDSTRKFFERSLTMPKITERDPLASSGIVCYAENLFGSVPCANRGNLKFCRTFGRTILVTSGVLKKTLTKSYDYSRLVWRKAPTKSRTGFTERNWFRTSEKTTLMQLESKLKRNARGTDSDFS